MEFNKVPNLAFAGISGWGGVGVANQQFKDLSEYLWHSNKYIFKVIKYLNVHRMYSKHKL